MQPEDISVGIGAVIEGCDEVFEGGAGVVCEFLEEHLGLFFREGTHVCDIQSFDLNSEPS
jgi:hypothetical protein